MFQMTALKPCGGRGLTTIKHLCASPHLLSSNSSRVISSITNNLSWSRRRFHRAHCSTPIISNNNNNSLTFACHRLSRDLHSPIVPKSASSSSSSLSPPLSTQQPISSTSSYNNTSVTTRSREDRFKQLAIIRHLLAKNAAFAKFVDGLTDRVFRMSEMPKNPFERSAPEPEKRGSESEADGKKVR